jgi:hypothetical protein
VIIKDLGKDRLRGELAMDVGAIRSARRRSENPLSERLGLLLGACHEAMRGRVPVPASHVLDCRRGTSFSQTQLAATARAPRATHAALAPPTRWLGSEGKE